MTEELFSQSEELFSQNALTFGRIHWYILKADNEMDPRYYEDHQPGIIKVEPTEFDKEVNGDEIHWWIFKEETEVDELRRRTENTFSAAQQLKEASTRLRAASPATYDNPISTLRIFADNHQREIRVLHNYVTWLHERDVRAPKILFSFPVWGSTRMAHRSTKIEAETVETEDPRKIRSLTEIVFGLRRGDGMRTAERVHSDMLADICEAYSDVDPEALLGIEPIRIPRDQILQRVSHEIFDEFSGYCEFIRNSLRNILLEIRKFIEPLNLIGSDAFWRRFIARVTCHGKAEPQLWDFKETLEMWHVSTREEKKAAKLKFAETVASFANARGGVLIIGVSNHRKVVGIGSNLDEIERRLKFANDTIFERLVDYHSDGIRFHQVLVEDGSGSKKNCLILAIAQADSAIAVEHEKGKYTWPVRLEGGLAWGRFDKLQEQKGRIKNKNFEFLRDLSQIVYDR